MHLRRVKADQCDGIHFLDSALEMQPLAGSAQLFGNFLRVTRLGAVKDQDRPWLRGSHLVHSALRPRVTSLGARNCVDV